jgi:hypothetical protein
MNLLRSAVSEGRHRFRVDDFDLDLGYIRPNMIGSRARAAARPRPPSWPVAGLPPTVEPAPTTRPRAAMGLPATGIEAAYRNPLPEVSRFLNRCVCAGQGGAGRPSERPHDVAAAHARALRPRRFHQDHFMVVARAGGRAGGSGCAGKRFGTMPAQLSIHSNGSGLLAWSPCADGALSRRCSTSPRSSTTTLRSTTWCWTLAGSTTTRPRCCCSCSCATPCSRSAPSPPRSRTPHDTACVSGSSRGRKTWSRCTASPARAARGWPWRASWCGSAPALALERASRASARAGVDGPVRRSGCVSPARSSCGALSR